MSMITVAEAAENWGISVQLVRRYCREKRISEAVMYSFDHKGTYLFQSTLHVRYTEVFYVSSTSINSKRLVNPPLFSAFVARNFSNWPTLYPRASAAA